MIFFKNISDALTKKSLPKLWLGYKDKIALPILWQQFEDTCLCVYGRLETLLAIYLADVYKSQFPEIYAFYGARK